MRSYRIRISTANCKYILRLNDFIFFEDNKGLQLDTEASFNELIFQKSILLSVELSPIKGRTVLDEIVNFECEITYADLSSGKKGEVLHKYQFTQQAGKLPKQKYSQVINLENSTRLFFDDAEKLELNASTIKSVTETYQTFWSLFKDRKIDQMREFILLRENGYAKSYGLDVNERINSTLTIYSNHVNNTDLTLYDFLPQYFPPRLQCFGRVVSLQDEDGYPPIFFLKKNNAGSVSIPSYFAKIKGNIKLVL